MKQSVGQKIIEINFSILKHLWNNDHVPDVPNRNDVDLVFNTSYEYTQPFLFRVCFEEIFFLEAHIVIFFSFHIALLVLPIINPYLMQ